MIHHTLTLYNAILAAIFTLLWGYAAIAVRLSLEIHRPTLETLEWVLKVEAALFGSLTVIFWTWSSLLV